MCVVCEGDAADATTTTAAPAPCSCVQFTNHGNKEMGPTGRFVFLTYGKSAYCSTVDFFLYFQVHFPKLSSLRPYDVKTRAFGVIDKDILRCPSLLPTFKFRIWDILYLSGVIVCSLPGDCASTLPVPRLFFQLPSLLFF